MGPRILAGADAESARAGSPERAASCRTGQLDDDFAQRWNRITPIDAEEDPVLKSLHQPAAALLQGSSGCPDSLDLGNLPVVRFLVLDLLVRRSLQGSAQIVEQHGPASF